MNIRMWHLPIFINVIFQSVIIPCGILIETCAFVAELYLMFHLLLIVVDDMNTIIIRIYPNRGKYCLKNCLEVGLDNIGILLKNKPDELQNTSFVNFVMEKHSQYKMYKINSLHERNPDRDAVYILGEDSNTRTPYVLRCPPRYFKKPLIECIKWNLNIDKESKLMEV